MSFLSGLQSVLGKIGSLLTVGTTVAQEAAPGLALIPGYGPAIVAGIQAAVALESLFPQSGLGGLKLPLATAAVQSAQPTVSAAQATAIVNAIVAGLNAAATAAAAAKPAATTTAAPAG